MKALLPTTRATAKIPDIILVDIEEVANFVAKCCKTLPVLCKLVFIFILPNHLKYINYRFSDSKNF